MSLFLQALEQQTTVVLEEVAIEFSFDNNASKVQHHLHSWADCAACNHRMESSTKRSLKVKQS